MTVRQLVEHLLSGDQEARVVARGHWGECIEVTEGDFTFQTPTDWCSSLLEVTPIDIGAEPE